MKKSLLTVLDYFEYFSYTPTFDEIYTFFPQKISKKNLSKLINRYSLPTNYHLPTNHYPLTTNHSPQYTLPQYSISIRIYMWLLGLCPFIQFVGLTGASALWGIRKNDDVDLCIVTKQHMLWTARFFVVLLAKIMQIHHKTGVCLNLFFDESDLVIPSQKQNVYIAHELLQMKPILDKYGVYEQFFQNNKWIYQFFPNAPYVTPVQARVQPINFNSKEVFFDWIPASAGMTQKVDHLFKSFQLPIIKKNKTSLIITPTQLWLFKSDFEKKLKRSGLVK